MTERREGRIAGRARRWANVRWGVGWGLAFAVAYSLFVAGVYAVAGPARFMQRDVTLGSTVAAYLFGGAGGGGLLGLLRPLTRSRFGATFVGVIVCMPVSLGFLVAMHGAPTNWNENAIVAAAGTAVLLGAILGHQSWEPPAEQQVG